MLPLNENRYPAPAEAALIREQLAADEAAHAVLQQRAARSSVTLHNALSTLRIAQEAADSALRIHNEIAAHKLVLFAQIARTRALLHPIRRLPDDILSLIFSEYVHLSPTASRRVLAAVTCAAVCASWRQAALNTPSLWREINIQFALMRLDTVNLWTDYVVTFVERSRGVTLDVSIQGYSRNKEPLPLQAFWRAVRCCCFQARQIDFNIVYSAELESCFSQAAPHLTSFSLSLPDNDSVPDAGIAFFYSAPLLKTFVWSGPKIVWHPDALYDAVTCVDLFPMFTTALELRSIFRRMPNMEDLTVCTSSRLHMGNMPSSFAIQSDSLRSLRLEGDDFDEAVIRRIRFPRLHTANLGMCTLSSHNAATALLQHTLSAVAFLTLEQGATDIIVEGLRALDRLQGIGFQGYEDTAELLFDELAQPDAGGSWLCPQLETLRLTPNIPRQTICTSLLRIARARGRKAPAGHRPPGVLKLINIGGGCWGHQTPANGIDIEVLREELEDILAAPP